MLQTHLKNFKKKKDFLICIDSDGTAMDVMNIKHKRCFGPCFVSEWGLDAHAQDMLALWNDINLYKSTRGNNRFLTLYMALCEVNEKYCPIPNLQELKNWLDTTKELSNRSLSEAAEQTNSEILYKALRWSQAVNAQTALLTYDDKKPFDGVKEFLHYASRKADIAIVSSAGYEIIREEWRYHGLINHVGVICAQEDGTKKACLQCLREKGYDGDKVLMVGDALSDMAAAHEAGVAFYPMQIDKEAQSWAELKNTYFTALVNGTYKNEQAELERKFNEYFEK